MSILVLGGGILYVRSLSKSTPQPAAVVAAIPGSSRTETPDSDGDGLKDWEEALWKTDPNKSDTDGDGTPDGEEIAKNRNPLKAAPNDELTAKDIKPLTPYKDIASANPSEAFAQNFLTNFITLKQQGMSDKEIQDYLSIAMPPPKTTPLVIQKKFYTRLDLTIQKNATAETIKKYADDFGYVLTSSFGVLQWNELVLLAQLLSNFDNGTAREKFVVFDYYRQFYAVVSQEMIALAVPDSYSDIHLELANSLRTISQINQTFRDLPNNLFAAPDAIKAHIEAAERLHAAFGAIALQLKKDRISITAADSAYIFVTGSLTPPTP